MDLAHRFRGFPRFTRLSLGVRELQGKLTKRRPFDPLTARAKGIALPPIPPAIRAGSLLATALLLGAWASTISRQEAEDAWERAHPPALAAWLVQLGPLGYRQEQRTDAIQRALRKLPSRLEGEEATVWISSEHEWIALLNSSSPDEPPCVLCRDCKSLPAAWAPSGRGWAALEAVSRLLNQDQKGRPKTEPLKRTPGWRDPRQLAL